MSWFQLDASTIACRVHAEGDDAKIPSLLGSMLRGIVGFMMVSVAGFVPWAVFGGWLLRRVGEGGMFGVCALVFIMLSGLLLHRLIIGPDSLVSFYMLFTFSFTAYAVAWIVGWLTLGGVPGSLAGLLAGAIVMGWMLTRAFEILRMIWGVIPVLFVCSALGYFGGGWVESRAFAFGGFGLAPDAQSVIAKLLWGACYGAGFGAGLGLAFYLCQTDAREFLRAESAPPAGEGAK